MIAQYVYIKNKKKSDNKKKRKNKGTQKSVKEKNKKTFLISDLYIAMFYVLKRGTAWRVYTPSSSVIICQYYVKQ